jgi:hypothetical protein
LRTERFLRRDASAKPLFRNNTREVFMLTKRFPIFLTSTLAASSLVVAQTITQPAEPQQSHGGTGIFVLYGDGLNVGARFVSSPSLVVRPSIGVYWTKQKMPSSLGEYSSRSVNLAIEFLSAGVADPAPQSLHPYYGGGLRFSYGDSKTEYPASVGYVSSSTIVTRFLALRGLVGCAFWMSDRFGFFGEVGLSVGDDPSLDGSNFNLSSFSRLGLTFVF